MGPRFSSFTRQGVLKLVWLFFVDFIIFKYTSCLPAALLALFKIFAIGVRLFPVQKDMYDYTGRFGGGYDPDEGWEDFIIIIIVDDLLLHSNTLLCYGF